MNDASSMGPWDEWDGTAHGDWNDGWNVEPYIPIPNDDAEEPLSWEHLESQLVVEDADPNIDGEPCV